MKISVVIPIYNRKRELEQALISLSHQSFKDFEVIIIDDGSLENYDDLLGKYCSLKINYSKFEHSGNIAKVRNEGLRRASGDYIAVLDSDDYCHKDRFVIQKNFLDQNNSIDILATWVYLISEKDSGDYARLDNLYNQQYTLPEIIYQNMNFGCCICHSSVMYRRESILKLGGYDERFGICEDYKLWMDAVIHGYGIYVLNNRLVYRTLHRQSVTRSYDGSIEAIEKILTIKLEYLVRRMKILKKIVILGVTQRNKAILPLIHVYFKEAKEVTIYDVYGQLPQRIDADYIFVSTHSARDRVFHYLDLLGKVPIKDYIYL